MTMSAGSGYEDMPASIAVPTLGMQAEVPPQQGGELLPGQDEYTLVTGKRRTKRAKGKPVAWIRSAAGTHLLYAFLRVDTDHHLRIQHMKTSML